MVDKYNVVLESHISTNNTFCGLMETVCLVLLFVLIFSCVKATNKKKKRETLYLILLLCAILVATVVLHSLSNNEIKKDIKQASYEEYIGYFSYGERNEMDSILTLMDTQETKLRYDDVSLLKAYDETPFPDVMGECYGRVVYSSDSKIVVFVEIWE